MEYLSELHRGVYILFKLPMVMKLLAGRRVTRCD
jgi:hypothetical protein